MLAPFNPNDPRACAMCDEIITGKPVLVDGSAFCGEICAEAHDELVREHREVTEEQAAEMAAEFDREPDPFLTDAEADADALASAGMGTDEDYFHFPDERDEWHDDN